MAGESQSRIAMSPPDERQWRRSAAAVAPFVFFVVLTFVAIMVSASLLLPIFRVPDEAFHVDMVRVAAQPSVWIMDGWPAVGERQLSPEVTAARRIWRTKARGRTINSAPPPRAQRPSFDAMGTGDAPRLHNRMTQHPPLHYIATALATWPLKAMWPGDLSFDQEIWLYRLVSVAMLAPLPLLAFGVCRELDVPLAGSMLSAVFLVAIPGLTMRNGAMVNNDNLLTLLSGCAIYLAVRIAMGATASKYAVLIGGVVGLASLTKGFGILLPLTVALAYVVAARRQRMAHPVRWWLTRVGAAGSVAFVGGMWWWARNVVVFGTLQPSGIDVPATPGFTWVHWLRELLFAPWASFWSGSFVLVMGRDTVLLYALISVMVVGMCASFVVRSDHDLRGLLVALSSLFVLMAWLYIQRIIEGRLTGLQGRYFYGAVVAIVAAVGAGWAALTRRLAKWLPAATVLGAAVVTTIGFYRLTVRYWGETGDPLSVRWVAIKMWLPVEPSVLYTAVAITVSGFVGTLIWAVRFGLLADPSVPDGR